jgi:hypothetical protein
MQGAAARPFRATWVLILATAFAIATAEDNGTEASFYVFI